MEAIQKAILKAKAMEKEKLKAQTNLLPEQVREAESSIDASDKESDQSVVQATENLGLIEYTKTRVIPVNQQNLFTQRIQADSGNQVVADLFKMLRTRVLLEMREKQYQSLAITGATVNIGKTLVAINLAISMALEPNQTIMLVDLDLKKPSIANAFGIRDQIEYGIGDYLLGDLSLDQVLVNPGIERLVLLPGKKSYHNSSEMISSPKMLDLIDELKSRYQSRLVVFDFPPVLAVSDALSLMHRLDAALMVVEDGGNTRTEITESIQMLAKTDFLGIVLNKGQVKKTPYYV